jgi:hypothetical protein
MIVTLLASCNSESYTEVETTRAPLFPGFESYASVKEIKSKLPAEAEIRVTEETSLAKNRSKPPYRIYSISVSPYAHLEKRGKLVITFYNDRLLQTAFYPEKLDDYVQALRRAGIGLASGQELANGHTVIWIGTDFDNKHYVGWADKRLREQQRRWLANYQ